MLSRTSNFAPALLVAGATIGASALCAAAPDALWSAVAAPLVVVAALLGGDALRRRRAGLGAVPSPSALLLAALLLVAFALVGSRDLLLLAPMIPIFGGSAAFPFVLDPAGARSCRRAARMS